MLACYADEQPMYVVMASDEYLAPARRPPQLPNQPLPACAHAGSLSTYPLSLSVLALLRLARPLARDWRMIEAVKELGTPPQCQPRTLVWCMKLRRPHRTCWKLWTRRARRGPSRRYIHRAHIK